MKKTYLSLLFVFFCLFSFGQTQGDNWFFGNYAGINFTGSTPTVLTNGQLNTREGCTSISDLNGNLLFYSDGNKVFNKNHQLMPNGNNLLGSNSSTQSAVAVPKPGSFNNSLNRFDTYYLFTLDYYMSNNGVHYSIIDMNLNSNLGGVLNNNKNIFLAPSKAEKIAIAKHNNGCDFWIIIINTVTNQFNAFLLNSNGLSSTPVTSNVTILNPNPDSGVLFGYGYMKSSQNSKMVAFADQNQGINVYDFNNENGELSYKYGQALPSPEVGYGIEFSLDNTKLYTSNLRVRNTYQYNLLANTQSEFINSKVSIGQNTTAPVNNLDYIGALQIAPNGKIYQTNCYSSTLNIIHNPNELGTLCNYEANGLSVAPKIAEYGLPFFPNTLELYNEIISDSQYCLSSDVYLSLLNENFDSVNWEIIENNSNSVVYQSSDANFTYNFNIQGDFTVIAHIFICDQIFDVSKEILIIAPENLAISCENNSNNSILFSWSSLSGISNYDYSYSINGASNFNGTTTSNFITVSNLSNGDEVTITVTPVGEINCYSAGQQTCTISCTPYEISIENNGPICYGSDAEFNLQGPLGATVQYQINNGSISNIELTENTVINIPNATENIVFSLLSVSLNDCTNALNTNSEVIVQEEITFEDYFYTICPDTSIELQGPDGYDSYQWLYSGNTLSNTQTIEVNEAGLYNLIVRLNNCEYTVYYTINTIPEPEISINIIGNTVEINVINGAPPYQYQLEDQNQNIILPFQNQAVFTNLEYSTAYIVKIKSENSGCIWEIPFIIFEFSNIITPNEDQINDVWDVSFLNNFSNSTISIYDRYGKKVAYLDGNSGYIWSGKYLGRPLPSATYWYQINIDESTKINGFVIIKNRL